MVQLETKLSLQKLQNKLINILPIENMQCFIVLYLLSSLFHNSVFILGKDVKG